jgi:hypothetical protein
VNEDLSIALGSDGAEPTDGDGEFDYELDNFVVETLE